MRCLPLIAFAWFSACAPSDSTNYHLPPPGLRCTEGGGTIQCEHVTVTIHSRSIHLMLPDGTPPAAGWPVAMLFQGSFHSAESMWSAHTGDAYGGYNQTRVVRALLDGGFAVVTPEATLSASTFWETNVLPYSLDWEISDDHGMMVALLAAIDAGSLGAMDPTHLFAAGISSGGYMTSRMAVSYGGRFRALAIESASYATCSGSVCSVPSSLPMDHPPTLFLHGEQDAIVPIGTMQSYADALQAWGVPTRVVTDPSAGHEWLAVAPDEIVSWFRARM